MQIQKCKNANSQGNMILDNTYKLKEEPKRFTKAQQPDGSLRKESNKKSKKFAKITKKFI